MERIFDVVVVGGGHAGSEAAHACAKLGNKTLLLTLNIDQIASMPCNPAIGGPAKSHLVKEIDALGGLMGLAADATYLQLKMLNSSKGPAVRSLRAQSDKKEYSNWVRQYLESLPNLTIYQSGAKSLLFENNNENNSIVESFDSHGQYNSQIRLNHNLKIIGVTTNLDEKIYAKAVILTAGTFLEGRIFSGEKFSSAGRAGEQASIGLSEGIRNLGLRTGRLKTGTPPRLDRDTIDFSDLEEAPGDPIPEYFSFLPNRPKRRQYLCHITRTNAKTHEIILNNLHLSPMYSGKIDAVGPRYCPSIEDKVVKFPHNLSHHFFLEPEGKSTKEIYLQGCSTSLPVETQWLIVRSLPGCKHAEIMRPAYAVEYDYFPGTQFNHCLESKDIQGLYVAGQVLGTSGYEEAAAQGLVASINASMAVQNKEPVIFERSQSYIGTLIDDLVTKEMQEPYRILTSRSEYRLLLRQDNADQRLTPIGRKIGLVDDYRWRIFNGKQERITKEIKYFSAVRIDENDDLQFNSKKHSKSCLLADLIRRPDFSMSDIKNHIHSGLRDRDIEELKAKNIFIDEIKYPFEVETEIKYSGYIGRQMVMIKDMEKYEHIKIPDNFDFKNFNQVSLETREKLDRIKPKTLGQASRIGGVTPSDLSLLSIVIEANRRNNTICSAKT